MTLPSTDAVLQAVVSEIHRLDPGGTRTARVLRDTLDQLYDGQRTGRYRWDQLYKTEKTHCGTLVEINLQREFGFKDGDVLDFSICGTEVDCKYSQRVGGWMIPPEADDHLSLVAWADDVASKWSLGIVRVTAEILNLGSNRDAKRTISRSGQQAITWIFPEFALPANILLHLDRATVDSIMALRSGQRRINALFRATLGKLVGRGVVATVARQDDYMKRVRVNGGARTALRPEGIVVLGQYQAHARVAKGLGLPVPCRGESLAVRLAPAEQPGVGVVEIDQGFWRVAGAADPVVTAPLLPKV